MNFPQVLALYLTANILIVLAFFAAIALPEAFRRLGKPLLFSAELRLNYLIVTSAVVLTAIAPLLPKQDVFPPIVKVWSAPDQTEVKWRATSQVHSGFLDFQTGARPSLALDGLSDGTFWVFVCLCLAGFGKLLWDVWRLLEVRRKSFRLRSLHEVHLLVCGQIRVPFSFWLPGQKNVVIPEKFVGTRDLKMAVLHELQHHRQQDTKWVYLLWILRTFFLPNPAIHLWNKRISEIQEFACDEALVDQGKVESLAYASCLVQVAKTAFDRETQPVCATGLMFMVERKILQRRIQAMLDRKISKFRLRVVLPLFTLVLLSLGFTAYATQGLVQDRRVTLAQAQEMAKVARNHGSDFPIVVNDLVVRWLNYYLGTPGGREKVRAALIRMEIFKTTISAKIGEYRMPEEMLAIPFTETGYQNLEAEANPIGAAGLWQFMPRTAQNYGLKVDDQGDDRMKVDLATDAAMRYLLSNRLRFKDWGLALLSYNAGENAVQTAIEKTGSRDPWILVRRGFTSQEATNYLPKLIAAILILKNPSLVQ